MEVNTNLCHKKHTTKKDATQVIIYKAVNIITTEVYVGKTTNSLRKRVGDHKYEAFTRNRESEFYRALREFGCKAFTWQVLALANTCLQLARLERLHILKEQSVDYGYNMQYR